MGDLAARLGIEVVAPPSRAASGLSDVLVLLAVALIVLVLVRS